MQGLVTPSGARVVIYSVYFQLETRFMSQHKDLIDLHLRRQKSIPVGYFYVTGTLAPWLTSSRRHFYTLQSVQWFSFCYTSGHAATDGSGVNA